MSRIGLTPIKVPDGVEIKLEANRLAVKGSKGELSTPLHRLIKVEQNDQTLLVKRQKETKVAKSLHGTTQRLISNMITGVTEGYVKELELVGTGYRVAKQGKGISLSLGLSHTVEYEAPEGVKLDIEGNNKIKVSGIDKQQVGQVAAEIRSYRKPEPYKGKGIRYQGEVIRRKAGKAASKAG